MEDVKIFWQKIKHLYKVLCQDEWNPTITGIVVALLSVLIMAWWRPWGAVGAIRNWGDWMLWSAGIFNGDLAELVGFVNEDGDKILTPKIDLAIKKFVAKEAALEVSKAEDKAKP